MNLLNIVAAGFSILLLCHPAHSSEDKIGVMSVGPSADPEAREAVVSADFEGTFRLWIAGLDGTNLRKLKTPTATDPAISETEPFWCTNRRIVYTSISGNTTDIWAVDPDGGNPLQLTANSGKNTQPACSPDGGKIAFVSDRAGTKDIWVMNANGSQQLRLLDLQGQENSPAFSPTGHRLVFSSGGDSGASLMIVNTNGTDLRTLTSGQYNDWEPSWGPAGIVFSSNRDTISGRWKLWVVQPDGSGLRKLGDVAGHDPRWLRDGQVTLTEERAESRALATASIYNPSTAGTAPIMDVQGYAVKIDIRPGKNQNLVNAKSGGRIEVAILSSSSFDASKLIDQTSLTFGNTGNENSLVSCSRQFKDVNGDGLLDLSCRFSIRALGFRPSSTVGILRFLSTAGVPYEGRDMIEMSNKDDPTDFNY